MVTGAVEAEVVAVVADVTIAPGLVSLMVVVVMGVGAIGQVEGGAVVFVVVVVAVVVVVVVGARHANFSPLIIGGGGAVGGMQLSLKHVHSDGVTIVQFKQLVSVNHWNRLQRGGDVRLKV